MGSRKDTSGRLLDIGCGADALTLRCAKYYPEAQLTGIDYWGVEWNYLDFPDETFDAAVRYNYWAAFQDYAFMNAQFAKEFKRRKPSPKHWMNFSVGSSDCYISVSQLLNKNEIKELSTNNF